jgi:hypothetical protein
MVVVPNVAPDTPALRRNPVFMYFQDGFQKPNPFSPDIAVSIDDVIEKKIDMMDAHVSQMYEWLPWVDGKLDTVPRDARPADAGCGTRAPPRRLPPSGRARQEYGAERGMRSVMPRPSRSANTARVRRHDDPEVVPFLP